MSQNEASSFFEIVQQKTKGLVVIPIVNEELETLVFVSTDHSINKADVQYLEHQAIQLAKDCGRYELTNDNKGTKPHLPADQRDVVEEFWDFIKLLTAFYGCRIFSKPNSTKITSSEKDKELFYLKNDGHTSVAIYENGEIVILKGSEIREKTVDSVKQHRKKRERFIQENCVEKDGKFILNHDFPVSSPSSAALLVSGTGFNGWNHWKTKEGNSLGEIFRNDK